MNERSPALAALTVFAITSAASMEPAYARNGEGPYFGLNAAGINTEDNEADGVGIEFDTGFGISGLIGYQFQGLRLEGEFGFQGLEGLSDNGVNSDVDVGRFTFNGYVDLPVAPNFGPYVGGGFGVANLQADGDFEDEDNAFTLHGEVGLNLNLSEQFTVAPFYRYQWIDTDLGGQSEPLTSHLFGVSLRYVLTWQGRGNRYRRSYDRHSNDRRRYGAGYSASRSFDRYDRYDDPYYDRHHRHRKTKKPKSPEQIERDRCGWKGAGCDDEKTEGWRG